MDMYDLLIYNGHVIDGSGKAGFTASIGIQNGKIVGAVTHVLVADPTAGYGIFAENMIAKMQ